MLDRTHIVDENFSNIVRAHDFPAALSETSLTTAALKPHAFLNLFDSMMISRHLDFMARELKEKQQGFYTIGSSGHEGNAAVAAAFRHTDPAFLHYRSGAFMIERARSVPEIDSIYDTLLSLVASKEDPIAGGRHKVWGSVPLCVPPQTSTIASHLPKAVGMAFSLTRAKELKLNSTFLVDSVVLCSFGDASFNHSTAQGALNTAAWIAHTQYPLPLVFICEDNGIGISVPTPKRWIVDSMSQNVDLHYILADGLNPIDVYAKSVLAAHLAREQKKPVFLHLKTVRLLGHAGSDIETQYQTEAQISLRENNDPLLHTAREVISNGLMTSDAIIARYEHWRNVVAEKAQQAILRPKLTTKTEIMASLIPPARKEWAIKTVTEEQRKLVFGDLYAQLSLKRNLSQCINFALIDAMLSIDTIVLFGEDVAKKGGVYRVTPGLLERFGQRRVFDTILDEQTILGLAIGFAQNGFLPIPEIQFLAYLHNAIDQLRGEAATLSFFSNGQYTNPLIIRIAGLAYQKGFGGHFHNDNSFAAIRDIPSVLIACPSNGSDAAKMLRTAVDKALIEQRIVVFLEPIALYMTKDLYAPGDNLWLCDYPSPNEKITWGEVGVRGPDESSIVILSYGNGFYLSLQAARKVEEERGIQIKVVDIRWLAPLPLEAILQQVKDAKAILIVDESRKTGSISEALFTLLYENCKPMPPTKRVVAEDSFIPLGKAWEAVLPSCEDIVAALKGLL